MLRASVLVLKELGKEADGQVEYSDVYRLGPSFNRRRSPLPVLPR